MKAVVLMGGLGTRLQPLTLHVPKPAVPIVNRPFALHFLNYLKKFPFEEVVLSVGYLPDVLVELFHGVDPGIPVTCVVEDAPLGTGGGVKNAEELVGNSFFVFNGDIMTDVDLGRVWRFHREKGAAVTIVLTPVEDPSRYGLVQTDGDGRIARFIEKPRPQEAVGNNVNAGIYIFERRVLEYVPRAEHFSLERQLYPRLLEEDVPLYGFSTPGYWVDIGSLEGYLKVHRDALDGKLGLELEGQESFPGVTAGQGVYVHPDAVVEAPALIGEGGVIEKGARVLDHAVLGKGARVGPGSVVSGSVLWEGVRVGDGAVVTNSVVGTHATIGDASRVNGAIVGCYERR